MEFSVKKFDLLTGAESDAGRRRAQDYDPDPLAPACARPRAIASTLTATDLELSIRTSCEAKVKKEGAGTIPAKKLLELVRLLPEGEIRFKLLENHWMQITSDRRNVQDGGHGQG